MKDKSPPMIILDTDLDTDCDDAGALSVLHALDRGGNCRLAGVICGSPIEACAAAARAINLAAGRADIPVGQLAVSGYAEGHAIPEYRRRRALFVERVSRIRFTPNVWRLPCPPTAGRQAKRSHPTANCWRMWATGKR